MNHHRLSIPIIPSLCLTSASESSWISVFSLPRLVRQTGYKYVIERAKRNEDRSKKTPKNETKIRRGKDREEEEEGTSTRGTGLSGEGRGATSASTRVPGANADDSSFLARVGYFRPATIFEGDSSRGFAAVLVRVCARWPAQRRRPPHLCRETRRQRSRFAGIYDQPSSSPYIRLNSDRENL